jgi:replication factor C subunit 3/5
LTAEQQSQIQRDEITVDTVYDCVAAPHPADITLIRDTLLSTPDVGSCLSVINTLKKNKGLALADILAALSDELTKLDVPRQTRVVWMQGLSEIEWRLSGGGNEAVQTGGLVGVVRTGCDLAV